MHLKYPIILLIATIFLTSCQGEPTSSLLLPEVNPSIIGLAAQEVDQPTVVAIREGVEPYLRANPYTEYKSGSQLLQYLVSSGEFGQAEITLSNGETYQVDVVYAYALMNNQRVLVIPVLVGLGLPDGGYIYFSEKYSFEADGGVTSTNADRQTALADSQFRLPPGRIFRLLVYGMATRLGPDWKACASISFYPPEICLLGALVEELFPGQTRSFVLRLADEFPTSWMLVAWVFQEFEPDELVPGANVDVPLPELSQP
jgi:hypothetical protein